MFKALRNLFSSRPQAPDVITARVDGLYAQAVAAWDSNQYLVAAEYARRAITLDRSLPVLHFLLASSLLEAGNHMGAAAAGEAGLALNPPHPLKNELALRVAVARARSDTAAGKPLPQRLAVRTGHPFVSVIICSITPEKFDKVRRNYSQRLFGIQHEIIGIHDARSLCEGYNRGARQARGDVLVFSHDDIEIVSEDFSTQLLAALESHDVVGLIGTTRARGAAWIFGDWPHLHGQVGMPVADGGYTVTAYRMTGPVTAGVQAMDGLFIAARRAAWQAVPFDEEAFDGWHLYDMDFSFRAHRAGLRCAVLNSLLIVHDSLGNPGTDWRRLAARFLDKHRGAIDGDIDMPLPALTAVAMRSADEWRRVTAHMIALGQ